MRDHQMDGNDATKAIEVKALNYSYSKGRPALTGLDLAFEPGRKYALIGPNGAGKTTLLKLMAGLLEPGSGEIRIFGDRVDPKRGAFGMGLSLLFQDPDDQVVMPTVLEDVCFGPLNLGLSPEEAKEEARKVLSLVGLKEFEKRSPHSLSFGEKRRAALAGVLVMRPRVILLDEPTANLDPRGRKAILTVLKGLDCTMVVATQDMEAAAYLADEAMVLDKRLLGRGPVRDVMTDLELLAKAGLEPPPMVRLFSNLGLGVNAGNIPMDMGDAVSFLKKRIA